MKFNTLKRISQLMKVASKDETRLHLCAVHCIRLDDEIVLLEATDGFKLLQYKVEDNGFCEFLENNCEDEIIISRDSEKQLKELVKQTKNITNPDFYFDMTTDNTFLSLISGVTGTSSMRLIQRDYPKTSAVIPKDRPEDTKISFNFKVLKELLDGIEFSNNHNKIITFNIHNEMSPIVIKTKGDNEENIILMPCRV